MRHYLQVPYAEKDAAKALGARWDPAERKWYAPEGLNLDLFAAWRPESGDSATALVEPTASQPAVQEPPGAYASEAALALPAISLSRLLSGVARTVAEAYRSGVWTTVEVLRVAPRNGHIYLELAERSPEGRTLAQARAVLWSSTAQRVLPLFEQATGAQLAPGIKLLVQVRPVFHAQYGFSLDIEAIDPRHTLGDLAAQRRDIRERLIQEGLFDSNRQLPAPWDYQLVLVIAPQDAAGLGDFQAEARHLETHGLCQFVYAHSRFQGEGAATEIRTALLSALRRLEENDGLPDAVVILRGGGAVNDLAWLNDLALARTLCQLPVPVLTGIGHERDQTSLDEVAHTAYDTPSKVIAGIIAQIARRAREAQALFDELRAQAQQAGATATAQCERYFHQILSSTQTQQRSAQKQVDQLQNTLHRLAHTAIAQARARSLQLHQHNQDRAKSTVARARTLAGEHLTRCVQEARLQVQRLQSDLAALRPEIGRMARRRVADAQTQSTALMREIAGQGPEKTLGRGFVLVRKPGGPAITSLSGLSAGDPLQLQFRDGLTSVRIEENAP